MRVALVLIVSGVAMAAGDWYAKSRIRPAPPPDRGLVADPVVVRLDPVENPTGEATVRLYNESDRPVEITQTETTCRCAQLTAAAGVTIPPRSAHELRVRVTYPEEGYQQAAVRVKHTSGPVPVEVMLIMTGRRPIPYVASGSSNRFTHIGIDSPPPAGIFRVVTFERAGGKPWLAAAQSQVEEVVVSGPRLTERVVGTIVERTYEYGVAWTGLPRTREFRGDIVAWAAEGMRPDEFRLIKVAETHGTDADPGLGRAGEKR